MNFRSCVSARQIVFNSWNLVAKLLEIIGSYVRIMNNLNITQQDNFLRIVIVAFMKDAKLAGGLKGHHSKESSL